MSSLFKQFKPFGLLLCCLCLSSCSDTKSGPTGSGITVTGKITWKGQPLKWGSIQFENLSDQKEGANTEIEDGNFKFGPERNLKDGMKYRVRIFGGSRDIDNPEKTGPSDGSGSNDAYLVPKKHNMDSAVDIVVKSGMAPLTFTLN